MNIEKIKETIINIISENFGIRSDINEYEILYDNGMDSKNMIEMVVELETEFDFEFDDDKISYETLKSVNSIASYIYEVIKR